MSGPLVSRVLESDLAPDLKFTAVVLASFADDQGYRIYPTIDLVAHLRGISGRQVQQHTKELRRMEILDIVQPATQWRPTHYRLQREKLPVRPPFKPPDRQPFLPDQAGDLTTPDAGVKPTSPLPGVKSSVPGVKPTSPDPSIDPSYVHTCTAHAREAAGVKPTSPLAVAPRLPLVVPVRDPDHVAHSWCGRICVPRFLHKQFRKAIGGPVSKRATRLRTFYAETLAAQPAATPIGAEPLKFWRAAFAARFGGAAPKRIGGAGTGALDHDYMAVWDRRLSQRASG
jgi:hypothetical protein